MTIPPGLRGRAHGVRRFRSRRSSRELCASFEVAGARCFVLDLRGVTDRAALIARWGAAIDAPAYLGHTWDALDEVMRDLSWARSDRYVMILTGVGELTRADPGVWRHALIVLADAASSWQERGVPMLVLVRGAPVDAPPPVIA